MAARTGNNALDTGAGEQGDSRQELEAMWERVYVMGEETDVLRQSHKSVFVAKLEKYVRKQIAAKRRKSGQNKSQSRGKTRRDCKAQICAMQQLGHEHEETNP